MQGYYDIFKWTLLRQTSSKVNMFISDVIKARNVQAENKQCELSQIFTSGPLSMCTRGKTLTSC